MFSPRFAEVSVSRLRDRVSAELIATSATTTAATASTTVAAATATAAATTATAVAATPTTATRTIFAGTGFVHLERPAIMIFIIQAIHRRIGVRIVFHFHKSESLAATRFTIHDYVGAANRSEL
jgi:electron transfer flavoprotein alpha subunit